MSKPACAFALIALATVSTAAAQSAVPDLRGTWKGERVDRARRRQCASRGDFGERTEIALVCLHADDRQAGWAPLLWNFFIAARRLESRRHHVARRHDLLGRLLGRRRGLLEWNHAGARPHGALLSQARIGRAHCLLRGIDETAVGKRPPLHHITAWPARPESAAPVARLAPCAPLRSRRARASPPSRRRRGSADRAC